MEKYCYREDKEVEAIVCFIGLFKFKCGIEMFAFWLTTVTASVVCVATVFVTLTHRSVAARSKSAMVIRKQVK